MLREKDLKDYILECSDEEFNEQFLFRGVPWYFEREGAPCEFSLFKETIASVFEIKPNDVALVGSGYFGMSLKPDQAFQKYRLKKTKVGKKSDLDAVIVSEKHFEEIWSDLLDAFYSGQHYVFNRYAKTNFKRFVTFNKKINISNEGKLRVSTKFDRILQLTHQVNKANTTILKLDNDLNFRVYRTKEDAIAYHKWSIAEFRESIR